MRFSLGCLRDAQCLSEWLMERAFLPLKQVKPLPLLFICHVLSMTQEMLLHAPQKHSEVDGLPLVNKNNLKNLFTYHTTSLSPGKLVILLRKDFGSQQTLILFRKVS